MNPGRKKHDVYFKIWDAQEKMYTDQTGRFPVQSSKGNRYMMVLVEIDSNYIDAEPMKNRSEGEMIRAYQALLERIKSTGVCDPKHHMLDNEASAEFQKVIREQAKLQLVPPDTHRRNIAERAIQTFKAHFIAILCGTDTKFPMRLWDRLMPQAVLTLNLLRASNVAPKISAYAYIHEVLDLGQHRGGRLGG